MAELWTLLTENPATFKGGGIWRIMTNINDALTAIAYGLLVLFFAAGIIKTCGSFTDMKKPEHVLKHLSGLHLLREQSRMEWNLCRHCFPLCKES